jgi:mercuric ion transport protein
MIRNEATAPTGNVVLSWLSLFSSAGTLICCALPSLLVLIGLGATVASVISVAPWLVTLSRNKEWVFAGSGALLALGFWNSYWLVPRLQQRNALVCEPGSDCARVSRASRVLLWFSASLYLIGFFVAFVLGRILE